MISLFIWVPKYSWLSIYRRYPCSIFVGSSPWKNKMPRFQTCPLPDPTALANCPSPSQNRSCPSNSGLARLSLMPKFERWYVAELSVLDGNSFGSGVLPISSEIVDKHCWPYMILLCKPCHRMLGWWCFGFYSWRHLFTGQSTSSRNPKNWIFELTQFNAN